MVPTGDTRRGLYRRLYDRAFIDTYVRENPSRFLAAPIFRVSPVLVIHLLIVDLRRETSPSGSSEAEITLTIVESILFLWTRIQIYSDRRRKCHLSLLGFFNCFFKFTLIEKREEKEYLFIAIKRNIILSICLQRFFYILSESGRFFYFWISLCFRNI